MTEILNCLPRLSAEESAVKCLSKRYNAMAPVDFEPRHVDQMTAPLTTRLRCQHVFLSAKVCSSL